MAEDLNRRNFLKATALAVGPAVISARGANDKINVGWIGVGTRGTAPYPQIGPFGQKVYVQIPVDIDENTLQKIADKTGGKYYRADSSATLRAIYGEIDRLEKTEAAVKKYQHYQELFEWFALPGLTLLLLEIILANTVWRKLP